MKTAIQNFFKHESASGILLIVSALLALVIVNSPLGEAYDHALHAHLKISLGSFKLDKSLGHWINDGLMALFFLTVGLEIKRELVEGSLREFRKALLPFIAALGGVIVPALVFVAFNYNHPETIHGWGIPMATDIAFAVGVVALLSKHVPSELKILLLSLAIIDDVAAILVIAIFYTDNIALTYLGGGALATIVLFLFNSNNVKSLKPYILVGLILWYCLLKSGVHATIAGVILAFTIPIKIDGDEKASPLKDLEHSLYSWSAFVIMPIFAFANAGFSFEGMSLNSLTTPLSLGIILGLFVGKQLGVFSFIWLGHQSGLVQKPKQASWMQIYGLAMITGIGFTVSLFIGGLAFTDPALSAQVRLSVLVASALSAFAGYFVLRYCKNTKK